MERTFVILKPDSVRRGLMGEIISRIEKKGFKITQMKMTTLVKDVLEEHYAHVKGRSFFDGMIKYMTSSPAVIMVVEGEDVVAMMRTMIGKTMVNEAAPGTVRGDFGYNRDENLIHASDSPENAEVEVARFFPELIKK